MTVSLSLSLTLSPRLSHSFSFSVLSLSLSPSFSLSISQTLSLHPSPALFKPWGWDGFHSLFEAAFQPCGWMGTVCFCMPLLMLPFLSQHLRSWQAVTYVGCSLLSATQSFHALITVIWASPIDFVCYTSAAYKKSATIHIRYCK